MPAATPAATGIVTGLDGNAAKLTFTKPAASAAAFHVIEYKVGEPLVAL